jgi:lysophospholipase L1-like esterase
MAISGMGAHFLQTVLAAWSHSRHGGRLVPMKTITLLFLSTCCGLLAALAAEPKGKTKVQSKRDAVWAQIQDTPGLPRVLLLGDSISMGYTVRVRELLAGKANVHRPPENCFDSANGLKKLDTWLGSAKWDVIHFNFGLHDNKYIDAAGKVVPSPDDGKVVSTPEQYEKNMRELVVRLKKTGATLICVTTTPVPAKSSGRREGSEVAYNAAAKKVAKEAGIEVNDLHAFVARHRDAQQLPNNVHFTDKGYEQLAEVVAAKIEAALAKRGPNIR